MLNKSVFTRVILLFICTISFSFSLASQESPSQPAILDKPMQDFTLPQYQGGTFSISSLKGKNILLVFPRGLAGKDHWCNICNYQYAEFVELEKKDSIRKKYDLEIAFVFPYAKELVDKWLDAFPKQIEDIENWKHGKNADERFKKFALEYMPKTFFFEKGKIPMPFPVLIDSDQKVSNLLGLYRTEWGGSKIEQNIPTVILIDKKGIVRFKYFSQNTLDRPTPEYILNYLDKMMK
jgi:peroxiredoxin